MNGLWSDPNNWSATPGGPGGAGVPQPLDAAVAPSGITARFDYVYAQPGVGTQNWTSPVSITQDVPTSVMVAINEMNLPKPQFSGGSGQGTYLQSAGTAILNMSLRLGHAPSESSDLRGYYTLSGNSTLSIGSDLLVQHGLYTQTGGICTIGIGAQMGNGFAPKPGGIAMSGGTLSAGVGFFRAIGASTFSGGHTTTPGILTAFFGSVTISGGSVSVGSITSEFSARFIQTGGALDVAERISLGDACSFSYSGGALSAGSILLDDGRFLMSPGGDKVARTRGITTTGTGRIDLADNAATVDYEPGDSPLTSIRAQIISAHNNGSWTGGGIGSSLADTTTRGVGYAEASSLTSIPSIFGDVDDTTILIRLTRYGDADLSGFVNLSDFNRLAANFGLSSGAVWSQGDFNYDGRVNLSDFNLLASSFGLVAAGPDVTFADWAALASAVPEPAGALPALALALASSRAGQRRLGR
jgi:hypothetical protein